MKKKSHPEFVRALKARNLKITVVGTYENCLSRVAVRCDVCGWEWAPVGGSLLRGHGCPKCAGTMRKSHAEFVEELKSRRDDVIIVGPYVKALEKTRFRFLPLRNKGCKSSICEIYTLFYTQECKIGCFCIF